MVITRLGAGVDRERMLDADAIERTLRVLRDYRASIDRHDVARVRAVATSAVRDAANGDEFLTAAGDVLGHAPELLSGTEEGRASFRGATAALPTPALDPPGAGDSDILVVDIGGPLSHAAVVARECGIPCVIGTDNGTAVLRTGDLVRVDGNKGTVEILKRAEISA